VLHVLLLLLFLLPLCLIPMISKVNMTMEDKGKLTLSLNHDVMTPKVHEKFLHHRNDRSSYKFKKYALLTIS
jgi:predicted RNA-binding protein with RPS1 domain